MYSLSDLLELVSNEQADGLKLHVGAGPIIVVSGQDHIIEGPVLTRENAEQLLKSVANTTQTNELRARGVLEFIYTHSDSSPFLIRAKTEDDELRLNLQRQV